MSCLKVVNINIRPKKLFPETWQNIGSVGRFFYYDKGDKYITLT